MSSELLALGIIIIIIGIIMIAFAAVQHGSAKVAVGGFIGPVPFGFASDPSMLKVIVAAVIIVAIAFILVRFLG